ncbi:MAG TPA: class I SAM-dependent methyltransferase [Nakamurella sp.]|nr:class I SAM-dependent methyltransferase [Nakamurella sp.]
MASLLAAFPTPTRAAFAAKAFGRIRLPGSGHNDGVPTPEPPATRGWNRELAGSFQTAATGYARFRPGYPPSAVGAALPTDARRVLDLAAGTGKLTGSLIDRGLDVVAVEPLPGMLAELAWRFPSVTAVLGSAEAIPLRDGIFDCVVVGQAFHWFDHERALSEMARVLRPGGTLSLLWNHDDETDPLVRDVEAELNRIGRPDSGASGRGRRDAGPSSGHPPPPFGGHPAFTDPVLIMIRWVRRTTIEDLVGLQQTYSYVIGADQQARDDLAVAIRGHARRRSGTDDGELAIPVICEVWRSTCR